MELQGLFSFHQISILYNELGNAGCIRLDRRAYIIDYRRHLRIITDCSITRFNTQYLMRILRQKQITQT